MKSTTYPWGTPQQRHVSPATGAVFVSLLGAVVAAAVGVSVSTVATVAGGEVPSCVAAAAEAVGNMIDISVAIY